MAKSCEISRGFLQYILSFSLSPRPPSFVSLFLTLISPLLSQNEKQFCFPPPPPWDLEYAMKSECTCLFTGRKKCFLEGTDLLPFNVFMYLFSTLLPLKSISRTHKTQNTYLVSIAFIFHILQLNTFPLKCNTYSLISTPKKDY